MRTHIKHLAAAAVILFAVAFTANAQDDQLAGKTSVQRRGLDMLEKDLQRSDVPGIVEGALYATIECKNRYPDLDYSRLLSTIDRIAKESGDAAIAYKAHLTSMYLLHSAEIRVTPTPGSKDHDYLFKQIADQLETKLLASAGSDNPR